MNLKKKTTKDPRCQGNSMNANLVQCIASFFHSKHINSSFLNYAGYVTQSTVVFTIILQWFFRFIASPIREKIEELSYSEKTAIGTGISSGRISFGLYHRFFFNINTNSHFETKILEYFSQVLSSSSFLSHLFRFIDWDIREKIKKPNGYQNLWAIQLWEHYRWHWIPTIENLIRCVPSFFYNFTHQFSFSNGVTSGW